MNFLFEPSILSLSHDDWSNDEKKDNFTENLLKSLSLVELSDDFNLLWSDEFEELLWAYPQSPPWRTDKDFKLKIVQTIFYKFSKIKKNIDINNNFTFCSFNPIFNYDIKFDDAFKNIFSKIVEENIDIVLLLGLNQIERTYTKITCREPETILNCLTLNKVSCAFTEELFIQKFWPRGIADKNVFENFFDTALDKNDLINSWVFQDSFIRDLINENQYRFRLKILETIYRRLKMTTAESNIDPSLQEESIGSEKRIRVTPRPSSARIHFKLEGNNLIFLNYYAPGCHDDGL